MSEEKNIVKISQVPKAEKNPFLDETQRSMVMKRKGVLVGVGRKLLMDQDTGEMSELKMLGQYHEIDQESFVKIYRKQVSVFFDLSRTGNKVLGFVLSKVEKDTDEIYIYIPDLMEYCEWGEKRQAYRGLAELTSANIIWPSTKPNIWFINPSVLFNGNRVAFIQQYKIKSQNPSPKILPNVEFERQGDYGKAVRKEE